MNNKKTCAELVQGQYEKEVEYLGDLFDRVDGDGIEADNAETEFNEYGLSFEWVEPTDDNDEFFRYLMSWGGPSDEFRFYLGYGGYLRFVEYHYMDWYDGAHVVTDKEFGQRLWGKLEYLAEETKGMEDY